MKAKPKCPCCRGSGIVMNNPNTRGAPGRTCPECNGTGVAKPKPRAKRKSQAVPTPLTDSKEFIAYIGLDSTMRRVELTVVHSNFARTLEKENATLRASLAVWESNIKDA